MWVSIWEFPLLSLRTLHCALCFRVLHCQKTHVQSDSEKAYFSERAKQDSEGKGLNIWAKISVRGD